MSGIKKLPHKLLRGTLVLSIFLVIFSVFGTSPVAAATLEGPSDYLPSDTLDETGVTHSVGFVIPLNGHEIVATDYIRITLPSFTAVTAPSSGSGWSGTPTYGITGNTAWITGVTAQPGDGISIGGVTATNPSNSNDFDVELDVANDVSGTVIYDSATFDAEVMRLTMTASVTVGTNNSSIEFFGYTSPGAFVTIMLGGSVAGTTSGDGGGNFHHQVTGLEQDTNYSVAIFGQDTQLRQTQTVSFIVGTLPNTNHVISNIVIPTTIDIDRTTINEGDILNVYGLARPSSQISVWVGNGGQYSTSLTANGAGIWTYPFDSGANTLTTGNHVTYAREVVVGGYTSIFTNSLTFEANQCISSDINCDTYVNLTDFSIMLFYWNQTNPANSRADINADTKVDLTDFSIMLFNWTG